jgi:putative intracellular protease/amidase
MPHGNTVYLLVFDGFADWEPAYALAELRRSGGRTVRTVGFTRAPVESMGGLRVVPDVELAAVRPRDVELLVLPGGDMWERDAYPRAQLESLIAELLASETPIAAICAGTLALGRTGALNERRHTSNMRAYLPAHAPEYSGAARYIEAPAVCDGHVITASGLAAVDFAREIFAELGIFDEAEDAAWFGMFKHGILPDSEE